MSLDSPHPYADAACPPSPNASEDRLRFSGDNTFQRVLRRRVEDYFKQRGLKQRDNAAMYWKTAIILGVFVASYAGLVFFASSWWQGLLLSLVLGVATAGIGFNIQHDGGHQAYSDKRGINKAMAMTLDMVGGSSYIWHWKHARFHHTYTNIAGHDSDIDLGVLARLSPTQQRRTWHRWQHLYLWVLYGATAIRWHLYGDFRDLITGTIGERPFARPRGWDLAVFVLGKLVFFAIAFGLPLAFHPVGTVLLFYTAVAAVAGLLLALVFQMAHVVEQAEFPLPNEQSQQMDTPWAIHQLETTVDFARDNRVLSWLVGGLNFQVAHHLFVRISHIHYPAIARIIEDTCREFGQPYHAHRSFAAGIASHYRWLRRMGLPTAAALPIAPVPVLVAAPLPQS
ncbi:fatty acid desaturase family protein [Dyella silvatica]|uniref:fatty acid desaturase family protein n=1 Tax=Dyella silvatica TaxID=2992128 RepID=UPI00225AE156|nr:acyl-CoA desaturase [Dyella silvatica]